MRTSHPRSRAHRRQTEGPSTPIDLHTAKTAAEILLKLDTRLLRHGGEIRDTFRRAAVGELDLPDTISHVEREHARAIFGLLAEIGPRKIVSVAKDRLAELLADFDHGDPAPGGGAPVDELLDDAELTDSGHSLRDLDRHMQIRLVVLVLSFVFYDEFHHPQPETGVYDIAGSAFEKLKWVYRYWFDQLEVAEPGSGLEDFFAGQVLDFPEAQAPDDAVVSRVSISCGGDLLAVDVLVPDNTARLFDGIADFYSSADIVSANLESTVDDAKPIGRHQAPGEPAQMNTSEAMFGRFIEGGKLNFFSTATNHSMDWGEEGVLATLDVLRASGAAFSGTAANQAEQDDVVVLDRNGVKVALLTFTFDLNGRPKPADKQYLVNEVRFNDVEPDFSLVEQQVAAAKAKGADYIVAYCHWGWEFEMYPHPNVVEHANKVIDLGVDTILGNHPHVPQPAQKAVRKGRPDGLITYAFGDFVSYHPESRNSKFSYVVKFDVVKESSPRGTRTYLANLQALPIYIVNAPLADGGYDCRIVKFDDVLADPDGFGLTEPEKSELPHLRDMVWNTILSPLSHIPS